MVGLSLRLGLQRSAVAPHSAPVNTVLPVISGTAHVGQQLSVSTGTWDDGGYAISGYTYQWKRDGANISGATANTYTLVSADAAKTITCTVTATNAEGSTPATAAGVAAAGAPVNTVAPAITGTAHEGETLTCSQGTWSANGAPISGYAYQWQRDGVNISGATASTHVVVAADGDTDLTCEVTATNAVGSTMQESGSVAAIAKATNTVAPAVTGNRWVGQTLTCSQGTWTAGGGTISGYTYQWKRGGSNISGATSSTYVLVSADAGANITCQVTASNEAGGAAASSNTMAICADEFWSSVKLLLGFEGADGATSTNDESGAPHTMTFVGNAQIDTAQFKFGTSSLYTDGSTDRVTTPDSNDWNFGSGPFTAELWIRFDGTPTTNAGVIGQWDGLAASSGFAIFKQGGNLYGGFYDTGGTFRGTNAAWSPSANTWYHLCLERNGSKAKHTVVSGLVQAWPHAEQAGITTPSRICHFLAQCFVESKGFTDVEEDLSYSAKRLTVVWPKRFPTLASAAPYAHNPQALANKVYGGRMGNTGADDGWKYRGRGIKQITGKDNYRACGRAIGIDLVSDPDALFDPIIGARAAIWYWSQAGCNQFADKNDIRAVTKAINGGYNGLADRRTAFRKAVAVWGEDEVAEIGGKTAATSNTGKAALLGGGLSVAGLGSQAYEVAQLVDSGNSISEAFGIPLITLVLFIAVLGLLIYIFRDRLFMSKFEGL